MEVFDLSPVASGLVIHISSSVHMKMDNVAMEGNHAVRANDLHDSGGNLALIYSNKAKYINSSVVIKNSYFIDGTAGFGGALFINSTSVSSLYISNCLLKGNHAFLDGGAVYHQMSHWNAQRIAKSSAFIRFVNCNFSQNSVESTRDADVGIAVGIVNVFVSHKFSVYNTRCTI